MPRLTNPAKGTVVRCEGDLATRYLCSGWADVDASAQQVEATPDEPTETKPVPRRGRPRKS